jgi:hypothetical protein
MKCSLRFAGIAIACIAQLAAIDPASAGDVFELNHYILGCDSDCADYTGPSAPADINPTFTGSWYDPAQIGQGLTLEVLPGNRAIMFWFTFNPAGAQQTWLIGNGTYSGDTATFDRVDLPTGGRWTSSPPSQQVVSNNWGTLTLKFGDPENSTMNFA